MYEDIGNQGLGGALGCPCGCAAYPMQVGVGITRPVVVDGRVHLLNVHALDT